MSSIFDTAVHAMRKGAPFTAPQPMAFIKHMARDAWAERGDVAVVLEVFYRHSVASRLWWVLTWWTEDGEKREAAAQEWDLCFWRAIQIYKNDQRTKEIESRPIERGGFMRSIDGYEDGAGI